MVVGSASPAGENPNFQAIVAGAHLERRNAAPVVMGVNQTGDNGVVQPTEFRVRLVLRPKGLIGANRYDYAVLLIHSRIVEHGGTASGSGGADQVLAAYQ